jgi:aspartyl-tRNA(Asn)/glutamyl-tRNA(Gln) amidotransferase subunit B
MVNTQKSPDTIARQKNLIQKSDAGEIEALVDEVIAANPKAVVDATSEGKKSKKAIGFLMGQVMQKSKGQANPKVVSAILNKKLG